MKKLVPNQKSLKFALITMFFFANAAWSQTVLQETFGSTVVPVAYNYAGGTSTPSVSYTTNFPGYSAVGVDASNNVFLNFVSYIGTPPPGIRVSVVGALPTGTGFNQVLSNNTNLITWTFNMKSSRLSTNSFSSVQGYPVGKYFNATVLCSSSPNVLSNDYAPGTGYAVVVQKSTADLTRASINLIKFSNGIGDASVVTRLIESPILAQSPSLTTPNNLSIKVTYNPSINAWELSYREDPGTTFVDPSSGSFSLGGSVTDVPTTIPMTSFGYVVGLQTSISATNSYQFDNFKIALSPLLYTIPPVAVNQSFCNQATVANLYAIGTNIKWFSTLNWGTALAIDTPLTTGTYYVSQTINNLESARMAVTVTLIPATTPTFTQVAAVCSGATIAALPTTSNNGITGTWSPSINNTETTTYTYTPNGGQCINTTTMTIVVNPIIIPTFTQIGSVCIGIPLAPFPTSSNNGITGAWSPAINSNATTTYTFTPDAGQCATTTTQTITVLAPLESSPISFLPLPVNIGSQMWTSTNLEVTTYCDGTPIPQVADPVVWANLTTGAWCYYNNDPAKGAVYGKLYNWYAVAGIHDELSKTDSTKRKKLAPIGWHVPTDAEWSTLTSSLGGENTAGSAMKEIGFSHWSINNTDATNTSNFAGLPGGCRFFGSFTTLGNYGFWWSFSDAFSKLGGSISLSHSLGSANKTINDKTLGFSVRCIKD